MKCLIIYTSLAQDFFFIKVNFVNFIEFIFAIMAIYIMADIVKITMSVSHIISTNHLLALSINFLQIKHFIYIFFISLPWLLSLSLNIIWILIFILFIIIFSSGLRILILILL
mgnify:CR=1 FL=1